MHGGPEELLPLPGPEGGAGGGGGQRAGGGAGWQWG